MSSRVRWRFPTKTTTDNICWVVGLMILTGLVGILYPGDGKVLAAPPGDTAETPNGAKKNLPRRLEGHRGGTLSLAFSADGKQLIAGGTGDPTVPVWDLTTNKLRYELPSREEGVPTNERPWHEGPVRAVAFSPDGKMIATGCGYQPSKIK